MQSQSSKIVSLRKKNSYINAAVLRDRKPAVLRKNLLNSENEDMAYENYQNIHTQEPEQRKRQSEPKQTHRLKTFIVEDFEFESTNTEEGKPQPDIYFKDDSDQEKNEVPRSQQLFLPHEESLDPPPPKIYRSFYEVASDCKLLSESRDLLNKIPAFAQTQLRVTRKRNGLSTNYVLHTVCRQQRIDKRFLMSMAKTVSLKETLFEGSITYSYPDHVKDTEYEVGTMTSDFSRNSYEIRSRLSQRKARVIFDDMILMDRHVKIQLYTQPTTRLREFRNIPQKSMGKYDSEMLESKRNIMVAPVWLSADELKYSDFVIVLKKISLDGFSLIIGKQLTPLEAFSFAVAHLDRQA